MARVPELETLIVRGNNRSDCAHSCLYCPIQRKRSWIDLGRYEQVVLRVKGWVAAQDPKPIFFHSLGYHGDYDRDDLEALQRLNGVPAIRGLTLGGLRFRNDTELAGWLDLQIAYGLESMHATFGGVAEIHDRWNNKRGNFDLLMRTLRLAGDRGLKLGQRMLVGKSTLSSLSALQDLLETLPRRDGNWRYAMPFFYQTAQQKAQPHVERDRIDEADRERLPEPIRHLFTREGNTNFSEREWIGRLRDEPVRQDKTTIVIRLTVDTIDRLERMPVAAIVDELMTQSRQAYAAMPSFDELLHRYGDRHNHEVYAIPRCVEMKWLDAYRRDHPLVWFDQSVTHCWFGG